MLSRPNRLTSKREFDRVFQAGQAVHHPLCTLRAARNELAETRFGIICSKQVGGAVVRNGVRRRVRHVARSLLPELHAGWDILIIVRPKGARASSKEFESAIWGLLRRLGLMVEAGHK